MRKYSLFFLIILFSENIFSQTIQSDIADSVITKFECKKLYKIIDAARNKFKGIRGARKNLKYSEVYAATVVPKGVKSAQIMIDGKSALYSATLINTANRIEAGKMYGKFLPIIENCLEGWIFETELENEEQLFRFKAHEKEDMISGISVEVLLYRKGNRYIVDLYIQP